MENSHGGKVLCFTRGDLEKRLEPRDRIDMPGYAEELARMLKIKIYVGQQIQALETMAKDGYAWLPVILKYRSGSQNSLQIYTFEELQVFLYALLIKLDDRKIMINDILHCSSNLLSLDTALEDCTFNSLGLLLCSDANLYYTMDIVLPDGLHTRNMFIPLTDEVDEICTIIALNGYRQKNSSISESFGTYIS